MCLTKMHVRQQQQQKYSKESENKGILKIVSLGKLNVVNGYDSK